MLTVRVDDFPGTKPEEFWRHNLDNFKRFDEVMQRHLPFYFLGVIPRYTDEEAIAWMSTNPALFAALHGRYHDERFPNEFRDHETEDEVYQAILSAKAPLDGINALPVDIYIPPHNVVDRRTVNALKRAGFRHLWGGPETDLAVVDYAVQQGLDVVLHRPPHNYGRSDELLARGAVETLSRQAEVRPNDTHLGLHWTWEWNIGLRHLDEFLTHLAPAIERL